MLTPTWRYDPAGQCEVIHRYYARSSQKEPWRNEILGWLQGHPDATRYEMLDDELDGGLPLFQPTAPAWARRPL